MNMNMNQTKYEDMLEYRALETMHSIQPYLPLLPLMRALALSAQSLSQDDVSGSTDFADEELDEADIEGLEWARDCVDRSTKVDEVGAKEDENEVVSS
jgi:hypothetical protein